jgi:hypothetical protein
MFCHAEVKDTPAPVDEDHEDEDQAQARGGTVKKSMETRSPTWLATNVRQVWTGGCAACLGWNSGGAEPALSGRDGARSGHGVQSPPPTDVPPTRARQGQRVRTTIRRGKARYGTGLIGLKNLRAWSQFLEGRIVEGWCLKFLNGHR